MNAPHRLTVLRVLLAQGSDAQYARRVNESLGTGRPGRRRFGGGSVAKIDAHGLERGMVDDRCSNIEPNDVPIVRQQRQRDGLADAGTGARDNCSPVTRHGSFHRR